MNKITSTLFSYCPKCGLMSLTQTSDKSFLCNDCGFVFYLNTAASVAGIILGREERLLVVVRKYDPAKGSWDLPGGFIDADESAEDAVVREVKEELNLEVTKIKYFGSFPNTYVYGDVTYSTLDITFVCEVRSLENIQASDDAESYKFVSLDNIDLEKFGLLSMRKIVAEYIKRHI